VFCFTGLSHEVDYRVYDTGIQTIERAIKERVFFVKGATGYYEPHRPSLRQFSQPLTAFSKAFDAIASYTTPMRARQFAESYQDRRKAIYVKAAEENAQYGFNPASAKVKAFVKCEKYNFTAKKDPVPRIIQPRDPRFLIETGRYIKPIEKKVYKAIDEMFRKLGDVGRTVFKGLNARDRGIEIHRKWHQFIQPMAIGLDAKRFDEHVSNSALHWSHERYQKFYPGDGYFKYLTSLLRDNKCIAFAADGKLRYHTKHNRMSGDSDTSCGNVLIMCAMVYSIIQPLRYKVSLVNDGDDCVLICERENEPNLREILDVEFAKFGFAMEIEQTVDVLEHIEFCQSHPVMTNDGSYRMVRDPRVVLSKDAVAIKPLDNDKVKRMWLAAVGEGGLSLSSGIPVMQEYYSMYKRNSAGAKALSDPTMEGGFFRLGIGMKARYQEVEPKVRLSYWLAFNITPMEQLVTEEYFRKLVLTEGDVNNRFLVLPTAGRAL